MTVKQVLDYLSNLAPLHLAEAWDNVGLLMGDGAAEVRGIVMALDPTTEVIDFTSEKSANLLVTHHPLVTQPLCRFLEEDPVGGLILQCARDDLNLIAMHTNLDNAEGGIGDALAARLKLVNVRVLSPSRCESWCKVAVFVPTDYTAKVRDAMAAAGAGTIGEYTHCSFQIPGTGTFKPSMKAKPFIGSAGHLETAEEHRLEMLVSKSALPAVRRAMISVHPYEEVAYDIYPLENPAKPFGCLRVGELDPPIPQTQFCNRVLQELNIVSARVIGDLPATIRHVAVCGGGGASFIDAVAESEADVYITGDIKHHDALRAHEFGQPVIDVGHAVSEQVAVDLLETWLRQCIRDLGHEAEGIQLHRAVESLPWRVIGQ